MRSKSPLLIDVASIAASGIAAIWAAGLIVGLFVSDAQIQLGRTDGDSFKWFSVGGVGFLESLPQ